MVVGVKLGLHPAQEAVGSRKRPFPNLCSCPEAWGQTSGPYLSIRTHPRAPPPIHSPLGDPNPMLVLDLGPVLPTDDTEIGGD